MRAKRAAPRRRRVCAANRLHERRVRFIRQQRRAAALPAEGFSASEAHEPERAVARADALAAGLALKRLAGVVDDEKFLAPGANRRPEIQGIRSSVKIR